jgi:glutamate/tyrosine decarboxylase-like PLP-dependent enzyme
LLQERIDKTGLNPASGGHLGYIPGGGIYASALGDYIAAITNRYAGVFYASPGAVRIENALINWVGKLIGYTNNFGGNLTSGGSFANLIAIATARSAGKIKTKNLENTVIYVCQQAHHSILKALKITGMEECIIRIIELDDHFRMNINKLQLQIEKDKKEGLHPFLLLGNAGSTDVGAVDSLYEMAVIAKENHLWFHVDAAYGGFFLLTKEGREKMKGIELADSVIMDPHKGLFIPYGLGIVMVKNIQHLLAANNFDANYMQDTKSQENEYSPSQLSPELSKHFRGLRMWLPLKLHGQKPFAASLEEKILLTRYFYEKVKLLGFKTGPFPDLSIIIFWFEPKEGDANEYNKMILKKIQSDGRVFISSTLIKNKFLLRFVALSFRTHKEHVDLLLTLLKDCIKE